MGARLAYLDSSAFVKLPLRENEHVDLRSELARWEGYVSSALLLVEAVRACARYGPSYADAARIGVESVALLPLDDDTLERASLLEPHGMRSLDAVHLATALAIADDVGVLLTYDERLSNAAEGAGFLVRAPGLIV